MLKYPYVCHPEEPQATKDRCICLIVANAGMLRFAQHDKRETFFANR
jgi:hypothetical protein